jgi:hypothetical protein
MLASCNSDKKTDTTIAENEATTTQIQNINPSELKKYKSVKEMLEDAHDFTLEQGTLKFINNNENNLHIQISKPIIKGDLDEVIKETVKRDIVYVAFQVFTQTSINKITISSVPIDFEDNTKYFDNYKQTTTISREKADQIMQEEFGSTNYSILFSDLNGIQVPNDNFNKLKFQDLDIVYSELKK